jgi:hypothetical protein
MSKLVVRKIATGRQKVNYAYTTLLCFTASDITQTLLRISLQYKYTLLPQLQITFNMCVTANLC